MENYFYKLQPLPFMCSVFQDHSVISTVITHHMIWSESSHLPGSRMKYIYHMQLYIVKMNIIVTMNEHNRHALNTT